MRAVVTGHRSASIKACASHSASSGSVISSALASIVLLSSSCVPPAHAAAPMAIACSEIVVSVDLKNKDDVKQFPSSSKSPTLFLTARPTSLRIPYASKAVEIKRGEVRFPLEVSLGRDVADILMREEAYPELEKILVSGGSVQVSGRIDLDSDPNTRDGEDLVGRTEVRGCSKTATGSSRKATLLLETRGAFGKFLTQRGK